MSEHVTKVDAVESPGGLSGQWAWSCTCGDVGQREYNNPQSARASANLHINRTFIGRNRSDREGTMPPSKRPSVKLEEIDLPAEIAADSKGKKKTPVRPITKKALRQMFETVNGAFALSGHLDLALQEVELDSLADAWHDVIAMYPQVGSILTQGNRFSVWGNALFVTFVIVERRRALLVSDPTGPARDARRDDGQRQDDARSTAASVTPLRTGSGYQA